MCQLLKLLSLNWYAYVQGNPAGLESKIKQSPSVGEGTA